MCGLDIQKAAWCIIQRFFSMDFIILKSFSKIDFPRRPLIHWSIGFPLSKIILPENPVRVEASLHFDDFVRNRCRNRFGSPHHRFITLFVSKNQGVEILEEWRRHRENIGQLLVSFSFSPQDAACFASSTNLRFAIEHRSTAFAIFSPLITFLTIPSFFYLFSHYIQHYFPVSLILYILGKHPQATLFTSNKRKMAGGRRNFCSLFPFPRYFRRQERTRALKESVKERHSPSALLSRELILALFIPA